MKNKCKMTTSGKHMWRGKGVTVSVLGEVLETWDDCVICKACGMIDDRKKNK